MVPNQSFEQPENDLPFSEKYDTLEELCLELEHLKGKYDEAIVILSGGIAPAYEESWKTQWIARMRVIAGAMEYYNSVKEGKSPVIITAGGHGDLRFTRDITASEIMKSELEGYNIPSDDIIVEGFSLDTSQNAKNCSAILKTIGFSDKGEVTVITNGFHLKRAEELFGENFDGILRGSAAEEVMKKFGRETLPGENLPKPYGEFASKYQNSSKNLQLSIKDAIIRAVMSLPGGQKFLTKVATVNRSPEASS